MAKVLLAKKLNALYPVGDADRDALNRIGQGEIVSVELRKPRNVKHHRLFWALMSLVWQQLDHDKYPDVESLVTEVKIITGHYTRRDIVVDGTRYPVLTPSSISFAAMDQIAFSDFFEKVCDWVARDVLPGVQRADLVRELEIMTGITDIDTVAKTA